jgi:acetyltransferase-like isoleucine patch superfamily enzyme
MKGLIRKALLRSPWRERYLEGFFRIGLSTIMVNFFVQRVLRINGSVPWQVHFTSKVAAPRNIRIGTGVRKSFAGCGGCYVQGINGIYIGDRTIFAPGVKIISANHDEGDLGGHEACEPINIGADCWIGANAVILPGVRLGDRCVVGAGAVVTRSFEAGSVLVGVPARAVR